MFVSEYNQLAFQFINSFNCKKIPNVTIIVGSSGLGKTLILNELHQRIQNTTYNSIFIDSKKFASKYAYAAYKQELNSFRKIFRNTNILLLDNINSLQGKLKTINELYFTLDAILNNGGKTVITYRGQDLDLDFLGEKFASKIKSGLIIKLKRPSEKEIKNFIRYRFPDLDDLSIFDTCYEGNLKKIVDSFRP